MLEPVMQLLRRLEVVGLLQQRGHRSPLPGRTAGCGHRRAQPVALGLAHHRLLLATGDLPQTTPGAVARPSHCAIARLSTRSAERAEPVCYSGTTVLSGPPRYSTDVTARRRRTVGCVWPPVSN